MNVKITGDSMWPSFRDGDMVQFTKLANQSLAIGDVVVFGHPLKQNVICVKRIIRINFDKFFVEGDNPDPTASEDSHNFGEIEYENILAFLRQ